MRADGFMSVRMLLQVLLLILAAKLSLQAPDANRISLLGGCVSCGKTAIRE